MGTGVAGTSRDPKYKDAGCGRSVALPRENRVEDLERKGLANNGTHVVCGPRAPPPVLATPSRSSTASVVGRAPFDRTTSTTRVHEGRMGHDVPGTRSRTK